MSILLDIHITMNDLTPSFLHDDYTEMKFCTKYIRYVRLKPFKGAVMFEALIGAEHLTELFQQKSVRRTRETAFIGITSPFTCDV